MRMMHNYFRIGGVASDLPYGWIEKCLDFCNYFLEGLMSIKTYYSKSYFLEGDEGVGIIGRDEAINWGLSGLML